MKHQAAGAQSAFGRSLILVILLSSAPPVALDLYLPAVPEMPSYFGVSDSIVNLTLVLFYLLMTVGMLVFGPVSDRLGRKRPMTISILCFSAFGIVASFSWNIWSLIVFRALQGFGGGGMLAFGTALVKDCFDGSVREKVLLAVQAISMIAPMIAPMLGALILNFLSWQGTLIAQGLFGVACLPLALSLKEPLADDQRVDTGVFRTFRGLATVARNKAFALMLGAVSLSSLPYMAYVSAASFVYVDFFHTSATEYSVFFGINAIGAALGSLAFMFLTTRCKTTTLLSVAYVLPIVVGILLLVAGPSSKFAFCALFFVQTFCSGGSRPLGVSVLLAQQERDTGSASSLINFANTLAGSLGMYLVVAWSGNYVVSLAFCTIGAFCVSSICFCFFFRRKSRLEANNTAPESTQ